MSIRSRLSPRTSRIGLTYAQTEYRTVLTVRRPPLSVAVTVKRLDPTDRVLIRRPAPTVARHVVIRPASPPSPHRNRTRTREPRSYEAWDRGEIIVIVGRA